VHVSMATDAGKPGRANEDFVGAVPGAAVLLDGAGIPGMESVCAHGTAWYANRLGGALLGRLSRGGDLASILGGAIEETADDHRDTCDLAHPCSPQATVLVVRAHGGRLDYLLLADSYLVLDRVDGVPQVVTDEREVDAQRACSVPLDGLAPGTPEFDRVLQSCVEELRARRNQPGGYWIAKEDPLAAEHAVTGSLPLPLLNGAVLLSNGASRVVSPYGLTDWAGVLGLVDTGGPAEVIRRVRQAEADDPDTHAPDDATVAHCTHLGVRIGSSVPDLQRAGPRSDRW
jgi:hypothetical protein